MSPESQVLTWGGSRCLTERWGAAASRGLAQRPARVKAMGRLVQWG